MTPTVSASTDAALIAASALPHRFERLGNLVARWAAPGEQQRRELRATASMEDLTVFYATLGPEVAAIAEHLDQFPIGETLPLPQLQLLRLAQMYMEAAWAVEIVGSPEEPDQVSRERWKIIPVAGQQFQEAATSVSEGSV